MARVPTNVVAVSTLEGDDPVGMLVGTFTAVSLDPLLVGFLGERASSTLPRLLSADRLSFCLVHESQLPVIDAFARPIESRFDALEWEIDRQFRVPVLIRAPLVVFGHPASTIDAGDHLFVTVDVLGTRSTGTPRPLVLCGGRVTCMDPGHLIDSDIWQLSWSD
jgi:3-hydroxy-9,10-secoandrosta-1,3,5(10)-triene-9,17-dione monooxygenase reductase component